MPRNKVEVQAAKHFAKAHGITVHEAYESRAFQKEWNDFLNHPYNPNRRKRLGLNRRLQKEGEAEENTFRKHAEIWRHTITGKGLTVIDLHLVNGMLRKVASTCNTAELQLEYVEGSDINTVVQIRNKNSGDLIQTDDISKYSTSYSGGIGACIFAALFVTMTDKLTHPLIMWDVYKDISDYFKIWNIADFPIAGTCVVPKLSMSFGFIIFLPQKLWQEYDYQKWNTWTQENVAHRAGNVDHPDGLYHSMQQCLVDYCGLVGQIIVGDVSLTHLDIMTTHD